MTGWNETTLGEIVADEGGSFKTGPFGTTLRASEYSESGVPVISVGEVAYGSLVLRCDTPRVSPQVTERLAEYVLDHGDIVFGRKGAVDRSAWVKLDQKGWFLGSDGIRVRFPAAVNSRYIAYQLQGPHIREWLLQHASGSTLLSLNQSTLSRVPLIIAPRQEQNAIAEVLGALDEKIAANAKLIATLDAHMGLCLTEALSKESQTIALGDVATFQNRRRIPLSSREREARPGTVPYYGASGAFDTVDLAIFDEPLVLVGEDGSVINSDGTPVVQYIWGPAWVNNHAHALTGTVISTELLYVAVAHEQVTTLVTGAAQPKINMGNLKRLNLTVPAGEALLAFERVVGAQTASKRLVSEEVRTLIATRDALLPQLMSGKLRVRDAEKTLAGVL